ncbi:16600_t:CDS:2, partial [Dentiscutata heterogama]
TLVRLLFLPQPLGNKNLLHKLLLNLCENSKTRGELISMLLSVLFDGSGDVTAVDKSFAQMSLKGKGTLKGTPRRQSSLPNSSLAQITQAAGENVPNLIAQRCLEALTYIVTYNEASVTYFLMEHDNNIGLKRSNSRKGKEKQAKALSKYPVVILLSLLDRQVFIKNTALMDQLMHLLSFVLRPLSTLTKTDSNNADGDSVQASETNNDPPQNNNNVTSETNNNTTSGASANEDSRNPATASSSTSLEPAQPVPKPPVIPDYCLRLVVNVLTAGECTSNTFKYTLTVIQHLSTLNGARDVITSELVDRAQSLGNDILDDLDELAQILQKADTGVDVQGVTLAKFSPSSSQQAKLLRVLKTIDYMYSRKQQSTTTTSTNAQVSLAPTVDPDEVDVVAPRTLLDGGRGSKLTEDEEKVMRIYDSLKFTELWKKLGKCLTTIHEKPDMIHVATVLLPLIESLMVVCKYVGMAPSTAQKITSPEPQSSSSESMEELFFTFTEDHRKILNTMVRNNPSLMSGSFSLLVHNPKILEFDNKRNYFNQQLHKRTNGRDHYGTLQLNVRRQYVFEDSYQNLQRRTGDEIKYGKLSVRFYEEEGVDAGGVTREWFQVLARQMFDENYALFKTSAADRLTYQPNRASDANPEHLSFFKFVGRVIGKAIYDGRLLDAYFTRSFYKHILGKPVDYRDVEAIDLEYYNSLVWMLNNDITNVVDLTFSVVTNDFGQEKIIDLKPNGSNITVTDENKREYVMLVTEQRLTLAIKDQIEHFLAGFHEIIPAHLISIFNEQELELLISGMPDIDIDDWKNNTEYQNYTSSSPQIQWFWRAVRSFSQEERAKLLQFVTGTSKVPLEGFSALQGVHGVQKFQIHKDFSSPDRLPSAHTCFNQLDIPEYEDYEQLRSQLLLAISEGTTGFGFQ